MEARSNNPWFLTILRMIKHSLLAIWSYVIKCFNGIGCFLKKRWKILVGVVAGIAVVICVGALCNYIIEDVIPQKKENKAVDIVESKLHSDDPDIKMECAYRILQRQHSDNFEEFIYYNDLDPALGNYREITERYNTLKQEAFDYIQKEAFAGDAKSQYLLGNLYYYKETFVSQDDEKAAYWWNEAALQGYVSAYNKIGVCYKDGTGVNKDMKLAMEWFKKGAEAGESYAQYNYGNLYLEGVKIQIGSHKELKPGYNPRLYNKYDLYAWKDVPDYEILIEKDIDLAKYWWKMSAEQGNSLAIEALQKIYN